MLNKILIPDKITSMMVPYHKSTKLLLPFIGISLINHQFYHNNNNLTKCINSLTIMNICIHSYVSTSYVISDYIKPKNLEVFTRVLSLKLHFFSSIGFLYLINNNYKVIHINERNTD
jgi:succinate dehydrogenase hydrophobic anchor subunit